MIHAPFVRLRLPRSLSGMLLLGAIAIVLSGSPASARVVEGMVALATGAAIDTSTVSALNTPFTDGNGKVQFVGSLADGQRFVWWDSGPVFLSGQALPLVLTGGESTMGASDTGEFIYSPSADGEDAVYTNGGLLLAGTQEIPPLPGRYSTFNSRPAMLPDGTCYWIGGSANTPTGSSSNRHLLKATDPTDPLSISVVLSGGDVIDGKTINPAASNFDFFISDDGLHHIHVLDMQVTPNEHVYLDGVFVAQEGGPTGDGDNWQAFDIVGVNNTGNYIFTGDTDGAAATDEFVAYNGVIGAREGDTIDGVFLASGFALRAAAINDLNQVAHLWGSGTNEHLFLGDGNDLAGSIDLLAVGDSVDVDGGGPDWVITDFNASGTLGPGLDLAEDGVVWVEVDADDLSDATSHELILGVRYGPSSSAPLAESVVRLHLDVTGPNPFTDAARLLCRLEDAGAIRLALFDASGRQIRTLWNGPAA
ncbi:MAG: hypothetical protein KC729_19205, partial [Candidatus Eisenbacteria bacterium]|nr:hypothetical protein [Candidatus Eisenbacteria bacterium]